MGEVQFSGVTNVEKNSGVWIDEQYVGYLKELKGDKKIMLLPGEHEISVRQAGYKDFTSKIIVGPGQVKLFRVTMEKNLKAQYPGSDAATLKPAILEERFIPCSLAPDGIGSRLSFPDIGLSKRRLIFSLGRNPKSRQN